MTHKGLLRVPASALMFRAGGPQVAVVTDDGKIDFRDVNIAIDSGDFVEIGSGVSPSEKVALNLSNQIAQGDKVTATEIDSPAKTSEPRATVSDVTPQP
jgi:multidrug efflux pump subunit AcrA (membrane-fusion protein)